MAKTKVRTARRVGGSWETGNTMIVAPFQQLFFREPNCEVGKAAVKIEPEDLLNMFDHFIWPVESEKPDRSKWPKQQANWASSNADNRSKTAISTTRSSSSSNDSPAVSPSGVPSEVHDDPTTTNITRKRRRGDSLFPDSATAPDTSRRRYGDDLLDNESHRHGLEDSFSESVQIVGPVAAEDVHVIERYLPTSQISRPAPDTKKAGFKVYSNDPRKPVLYTTIPRRRQGLRQNGIFGENQKEILEQILGPFCPDLTRIFLDRINDSFPILDENQFLESYESGNVPPPLCCQVYAMALVYWNHSHILAAHPKPDIRYAVNLAVAALHEEFSAPGLSTVGAALIDLTGRPIFSMTGNAINSGRVVALAHCLGLNRDPSSWKLSQSEKNSRIRLWWGVVIHDRWASYGHGVPPQISKNQSDVPLPTVSNLVPANNSTPQKVQRAQCYIELCRLTEALGELLPLVYGLQSRPQGEASKLLRKIRAGLDSWEDELPSWLRPSLADPNDPVSGSSSLHLDFLTLRMLVARLEYQEVNNSDALENADARRYFQNECRKAAEEIVHFMVSLKRLHFREFWLPYGAYHLSSTATLLVRCALETTDPEVARQCMAKVDLLCKTLRATCIENDWDLADMCIDHCEKILSKQPGINIASEAGKNNNDNPLTTGTTTASTVSRLETQAGNNDDDAGEPMFDTSAIICPETLTHNEIVDDMMSISGTFGTMNGLPFDMTGIWGIPGWQGGNSY
ncbi:hypothetical protein KEM56_005132 [Ascosphaera pollenicola]|nr:hypothetical protein KEM56_005132 [Ascosphaera pollenicola]